MDGYRVVANVVNGLEGEESSIVLSFRQKQNEHTGMIAAFSIKQYSI